MLNMKYILLILVGVLVYLGWKNTKVSKARPRATASQAAMLKTIEKDVTDRTRTSQARPKTWTRETDLTDLGLIMGGGAFGNKRVLSKYR